MTQVGNNYMIISKLTEQRLTIHIMIKLTRAGNFIFVNQFVSNFTKAINTKPPYDHITFPFD